MGLKFSCPACRSEVVVHGAGLGESTRCSACGGDIEVPLDPRLIEHIQDPEEESVELAPIDSGADKRGSFVSTVLVLLGLVNPLFGVMILESSLNQPAAPTTPLIIGILLILTAIPVYGLWRRYKWGFWGFIVVFGVLVILSAVDLRWEIFFRLLIGLFLFFLVAKSEWDYLK